MMRAVGLFLLLSAVLAGGCAFTNPANTPLLTAMDEAIEPETTGGKALLAPVTVPVGLVCGALDVCVVHPLHALVFAGQDTYRAVWANPKGSFVVQSFRAVPKTVVTPVVFAFCWVSESLFDLRPQRTSKP